MSWVCEYISVYTGGAIERARIQGGRIILSRALANIKSADESEVKKVATMKIGRERVSCSNYYSINSSPGYQYDDPDYIA
jgi:hypothetical protein